MMRNGLGPTALATPQVQGDVDEGEPFELIGVAQQAIAAAFLLSNDDQRALAARLVIKAR